MSTELDKNCDINICVADNGFIVTPLPQGRDRDCLVAGCKVFQSHKELAHFIENHFTHRQPLLLGDPSA